MEEVEGQQENNGNQEQNEEQQIMILDPDQEELGNYSFHFKILNFTMFTF